MDRRRLAGAGVAALVAGIFSAGSAQATEGYFLSSVGVNQTAVSGAGVAYSEDAMSMSINPAGIAGFDRQISAGAALLFVNLGYTGTNTALLPSGSYTSADHLIPGGNFSYVQPLGDATIGFAVYPNGGTNTNFANAANTGALCLASVYSYHSGSLSGLYCDGRRTGVTLRQEVLQFDLAERFGNISLGISPIIAAQTFDVTGIGALTLPGLSASPHSVTDTGNEWSFGVGVHAGLEWRVTPQFRVGLSGASETYMSKLNNYAGLLPQQGQFNIPAWVQAGVAYDINPALTVLADYKRIFYSDIPAMGNSANTFFVNPITNKFGSDNGPGQGWSDVNVLALGVVYKASPVLTLRAGAEINTQPIQKSSVWFNVLSPGITTSQFSAGFSYRVNAKTTLDFSGFIVPNTTVTGPEYAPGYPTATGQTGGTVKISASEAQVMAGLTYHFDAK